MILCQQNPLTADAAALLAEIAALSGHLNAPRDGILQLRSKNNSQGLIDLGITAGGEAMEGVKALLTFGEDPQAASVKDLEFLAVCDVHLTDTARRADVVFPGTGFACAEGTFTSTERRLQPVHAAIDSDVPLLNWQVAGALAQVYESALPYGDEADLSAAWTRPLPSTGTPGWARWPEACSPAPPGLCPVPAGAALVAPTPCADYLMNLMDSRMP